MNIQVVYIFPLLQTIKIYFCLTLSSTRSLDISFCPSFHLLLKFSQVSKVEGMINTYLTCVLWLLANTWLKNCPLKRLFLVYTISCKHTQATIRERILLVIMSSNPWFDRERKKSLPRRVFLIGSTFLFSSSLSLSVLCPCPLPSSSFQAHTSSLLYYSPVLFRHMANSPFVRSQRAWPNP